MMRHWSFYDRETGLFTGKRFGAPDETHLKIPEGCGAMPGIHDHRSRCVNLETSEVIDYQPPAPSKDHEWNDGEKEWQLNAEAQAAVDADIDARTKIAVLEQQVSLRSMREAILGDESAKARVAEIEQQIDALRPNIIKRGGGQ